MIKQEILFELNRRVPYLFSTFGGANNFITYLKENLDITPNIREEFLQSHELYAINNYLKLLLDNYQNLIIISPWSLYFDLRDLDTLDTSTPDSINIEEPYQIYSLNGNLRYSVSNHFGVFGESRLDKDLIVNSYNTSAYYIKYKTYKGDIKIRILIVNFFSQVSKVVNRSFSSTIINTQSTISIINNTITDINVYVVNSGPILDVNTFNFIQDEYRYQVSSHSFVPILITSGSYIFIDTLRDISRSVITNSANDILFNITPNLFYCGYKVDIASLNKIFNTQLKFSNKPINDVLSIDESLDD